MAERTKLRKFTTIGACYATIAERDTENSRIQWVLDFIKEIVEEVAFDNYDYALHVHNYEFYKHGDIDNPRQYRRYVENYLQS